ncbi:DUF3187 family protein, partial [Oligoflexaceae bacterium]|nr:DUF3187 family protein [Oligoflexaceae bacterium]
QSQTFTFQFHYYEEVDIDIGQLTAPAFEFAFGYRFQFGPVYFDLAVLENIFYHKNTADLSLHYGVGARF